MLAHRCSCQLPAVKFHAVTGLAGGCDWAGQIAASNNFRHKKILPIKWKDFLYQ